MAQVENYVTADVVALSANPSQTGFGLPLIATYHTAFLERVREYNSLTALAGDGFSVESPTYKLASQLFAQNPRPPKFLVGRRANAPTHTVVLTPTATTQGLVYKLTIKAPNGTAQSISYTVPASATAGSICTALKALIDALPSAQGLSSSNLTSTVSGSTLVLASAAANGKWFAYGGLNKELSFEDTTADAGIAADLTAILAERADWYALLTESTDKATILAASTWANSNKKLYGYQTLDTAVTDTAYSLGGSDVMTSLRDATARYTAGMFSQNLGEHAHSALFGACLPLAPGSETGKFKKLLNVSVSSISSAQYANVEAKYGNAYVSGIGALPLTTEGWTHGHEYIDIVRGDDWLNEQIKLELAIALHNARKVPYTDAAVETLANVVRGALERAEAVGLLDSSFDYTLTYPKVAEMSQADKAARHYGCFSYYHRHAGAIHSACAHGFLIS